VEAPTGGSVILAAIMLKMGGYGFLRFSLPIAPDASRELDMLLISLSLIAVVYIGFVAIVQQDMKKLIAYSSITHMGFVTLGLSLCTTSSGPPVACRVPAWGWMAPWCRWCRTVSSLGRCSCVWACYMTACIRGR